LKFVRASIALALLFCSSQFYLAFDVDPQDFDSSRERLLITFDDERVIDELIQLSKSHGSEIEISHALNVIYWTNWNPVLKREIEEVEGVVAVDVERRVSNLFEPNDEYFDNTFSWGQKRINAEDAWDYTLGSQDVIIAVLDTGIDYTHADLAANMWRNSSTGYYGYDFWNDDNDPMDDNRHSYEQGIWKPNTYVYHGTHVAGIAGAVMDNAIGISGMAQAKLMAVKVMNESGEGTDATVAQGIEYAVQMGADVICMSLGVDSTTGTLSRAVEFAAGNGVVLVAAAGNAGSSAVAYPAAYSEVISVGAIDRDDNRATFSNYGSNLDLMAPGSQIWSTRYGSTEYQYLSGTSTAAPFVAGVAALMLSVNPALTPAEVRTAMNETAIELGVSGWDSFHGWGLINAHEAVTRVSGPAATIIDYPSTVKPNTTLSISWVVSGSGSLAINETYLTWGNAPDQLSNTSGLSSGYTTPHTFVATDISTPGRENSILYLQAVAIIDGVEYRSRLVEIDVRTVVTDPFSELISNIEDLIMNDIGLLNFLFIIFAIIALATIAATVRSKRKAAKRRRFTVYAYQYPQQPQPSTALSQPSMAQSSPPPPPPEDMPTVYVDIIDNELVPSILEVDENTRVIWRNRGWAPPPGISIVSGTMDSMGSHPDGLFASGLMIAPGEYWSCIFKRKGYYPYYISMLGINGKILVRSSFATT